MWLRRYKLSTVLQVCLHPTGSCRPYFNNQSACYEAFNLLRFSTRMSEMDVELSEEERQVKGDFEAACRKLNMDKDSMDAAWTSYDKIKDNFTLEVRESYKFL